MQVWITRHCIISPKLLRELDVITHESFRIDGWGFNLILLPSATLQVLLFGQ